jgi:hypothetical protein
LGNPADYVPVNYGQPPPDVTGREVYILDFSYKRPIMEALAAQAETLVVLDHHKTAAAELDGFHSTNSARFDTITYGAGDTYCIFDIGKSGGRLAWEFFHPDGPAPWLVDYTEDRDLWRWKLEESREVNACLASWPRTFHEWNLLSPDSTAIVHFAEQGAAILRYQAQVVDAHVQHAREIEMDGYKILSLNATTMISEIGERLAEGRPFSATYLIRDDGKRVWSLRSRGEWGIDVSEIARKHGGGGHPQAAGFEEEP